MATQTNVIKQRVTLTQLIAFDGQKDKVMDALKVKVAAIVTESQDEVKEVKNRGTSAMCDGHIGAMKVVEGNINQKRLEHGRIVTNFKSGNDDWYYEIMKPLTDEKNRLLGLQQTYLDECRVKVAEQEEARQAEIAKREAIQEAHAEKGHDVDETPREELVAEVPDIREMTAAKTRKQWMVKSVDVKAFLKAALAGGCQFFDFGKANFVQIVQQQIQAEVQSHVNKLKSEKTEPTDENMIVIPGVEVYLKETVI